MIKFALSTKNCLPRYFGYHLPLGLYSMLAQCTIKFKFFWSVLSGDIHKIQQHSLRVWNTSKIAAASSFLIFPVGEWSSALLIYHKYHLYVQCTSRLLNRLQRPISHNWHNLGTFAAGIYLRMLQMWRVLIINYATVANCSRTNSK